MLEEGSLEGELRDAIAAEIDDLMDQNDEDLSPGKPTIAKEDTSEQSQGL